MIVEKLVDKDGPQQKDNDMQVIEENEEKEEKKYDKMVHTEDNKYDDKY